MNEHGDFQCPALETVLYIEVNVSLFFQTLAGLFVEYLKVFVLKSNMRLSVVSTCTLVIGM